MSWHVDVEMRLGDFDLEVDLEGGSRPVALIGPNGSGKTTLLRTIAGAYRPDAGRIRIGGRDVFDSSADLDTPPEARRVGYVPQGYGLFPHLTVLENVAFGWMGGRGRLSRRERQERALALLDRVDCSHLARRIPAGLSGGEQQRVALARALAVEPDVLLLDEPLAALDARARRAVREYLAMHLSEGPRPALVVSHDLRDVRALGGPVCVIERGRILQQGSADELARDPASDFVEAFFES